MHNSIMELMWSSGHLSGGNAEYVEQLYDQYLKDAGQVSDEWRQYFDSLPKLVEQPGSDVSHREIQEYFRKLGKTSRFMPVLSNDVVVNSEHENKQVQVLHLISSYRVRGHQKAALDPLGLMHREQVP
ncbi:MAG: 2-oxoglutarate dehydrogenase E1 component, partial [Gammaproteobacteria bacterium]|nr:2-oxoglutarate dehydrogenase E1 component [Gammaproteobacteria bacterium]